MEDVFDKALAAHRAGDFEAAITLYQGLGGQAGTSGAIFLPRARSRRMVSA